MPRHLERQYDILGRVMTSDETWAYQYDEETKRQLAQWKTLIPHNQEIPSVQIKSRNNIAEFFYIRGIAPYKFVPKGQIVNQA